MAETMKDYEKELEASYREMEERQQMYESMNDEEQAVWEELKQLMDNKTELDVKIKEIVKGGAIAFVNETQGFIPASKLALGYVENLDEYLGKHIKVRIFDLDTENKRMILSAREILKEAENAKKEETMAAIQVGSVLNGIVDSLQSYGAFVKLENGLSGLVHISQISNKRLKTPNEVLSVGDKVAVKVIQIKDGKLSLSIKALNDVMEENIIEEAYELPKTEEVTTSLGSLFANIKLDQ